MNTILKKHVSEDIRKLFYPVKVFFRRFFSLVFKGNRYISIEGIAAYLLKKMNNLMFKAFPSRRNKILWLGAFPPMHSNMGDHAQTLAVEQYFNNEFPDYHIICLNRNQISIPQLKKISSTLKNDDLVFIHSSGDFGSKYYGMEKSYGKLRKEIINIFNRNKIINLPTTVYYENNDKGMGILEKDRQFYRNKNVTILGREAVSADFLAANFECNSRFFPDFVFYLRPPILQKPRKGALLLLRSDKEAELSNKERNEVISIAQKYTPVVHNRDILKSSIPVLDFIRKNYIESICRTYQNYEFVITDRMHGMIIAVITRTPCIAINGGIPHKMSAYQLFLADSVEFINEIEEIDSAVKRIRSRPYKETDMSSYFDSFRKYVLE
jgi:pyruvyl transferase EpsI